MSDDPSWVIQTDDLQVGTELSFDLTDLNGQVLHKAGMPITERLKDLLQKKNIHSVTIRGAAPLSENQSEALLLDSYPAPRIQAIQKSLESTLHAIHRLVDDLRANRVGSVVELKSNVNQFLKQATESVSAALAVIALRDKVADVAIIDLIGKRSAKLSLLGVVTSVIRNDEPVSSAEIGLAALLHDSALLIHPDWFGETDVQKDEKFWDEYRRHPIESAELVNGIAGVSNKVISIITQVHEQEDGTGYPRGLTSDQTLIESSTLNLAEAYITLVEPIQGTGWIPADAMAYLCHHTSRGKFRRDSLGCFLQGLSLYPVGSAVTLDDNTKAIVIEGNPNAPMKPIVRQLHSENLRIDLSNSDRFITGPHDVSSVGSFERIKKTHMQQILWRTDR